MKIKGSMTISTAAIIMILLSKTPIALADTGSQLKNQINQIEKKRQTTLNDLQTKQSALKANQQQQSNIAGQVQQLQSQIESSDYKIQIKQNSIKTNQQNIQTLKNNIKMVQKRIKQRNILIADRARATYMNGGSNNYLQLLLDSKNFNNLVNRVVLVYNIAKQDQTILNQQVSDKKKLKKEQQALQITLNQLKSDLHKLNQMKASLDSKKAEEQTLLKQLQDKAVKMKLEVTSQQEQAVLYKQNEDAHKQDLSKWEAEQKRLAQQARARAQAQAQAQAQAKVKSSSNSSSQSGVLSDVQPFIKPAQELENSTGIPAAITLAQLTLESDTGGQLSELATAGKNLFGIKGQGPAGTIYLQTNEFMGGMKLTINAGFKKYQTYYQCMVDHANFLQQPSYQYFLKNAHSLKDYAYGIQDGGYATDPSYAAKLLFIIQMYGYNRFDTGSY